MMNRLPFRQQRMDDDQPRFEMTPMMDVVFILLIFFIFQVYNTIDTRLLPIDFSSVSSGETTGRDSPLFWILIDQQGVYHLNEKEMNWETLKTALIEKSGEITAARPQQIYLAVDGNEKTQKNLWPLAIKVIDLAHQLNLKLVLVGQRR